MAELSRRHADGMEKWADCVAAGKDDCVATAAARTRQEALAAA